ncbi:hypothetical protein H5410_005661 [Solanum commersonii]|uniref:Uncharacterized protein n=1 Tax=Solanum commersonii TaxID=4109 RepID=A0A9J6A828_SOLCO|nr:hypothetical protein H5410_005661 [Solanum commersonii]
MLMKWLGRFADEDSSLWKKVVAAKHGQQSHWEWATFTFWKDKWLNNNTLMDSYPSLYQLANDPDSTIAQNRSRNIWDQFRRNMNDYEPHNIFKMLGRLENSPVDEEVTDRIRWGSCGPCSYTVKAGYRHLCEQNEI